MLGQMKITEFLAATASDAPVPGGGSVAALSAGISASLIEMVANLTVGKKNYEAVEAEMKAISEKAHPFLETFVAAIDKDAESFDGVMKAFKLPKETDEEKQARTAAIQAGMKDAANVPLQTARDAFSLFSMIEAIVVRGNSNAVTDGAVAAMMARAAVLGAIYNVRINLMSIKDEAYVAAVTEEIDRMAKETAEIEARILASVKL